jgi:hypothetical protein
LSRSLMKSSNETAELRRLSSAVNAKTAKLRSYLPAKFAFTAN